MNPLTKAATHARWAVRHPACALGCKWEPWPRSLLAAGGYDGCIATNERCARCHRPNLASGYMQPADRPPGSRGRAYELGQIHPPSSCPPVRITPHVLAEDDVAGYFLATMLAPPEHEGPPYVHTFTLPETRYRSDEVPERGEPGWWRWFLLAPAEYVAGRSNARWKLGMAWMFARNPVWSWTHRL